mmetsp:Transcript_32776/g.92477  ORF Transcript_32776/g.92477 Transcript_32776/m.92477 type:complete len:605 (+) Transcript_32776:75-1889(+)
MGGGASASAKHEQSPKTGKAGDIAPMMFKDSTVDSKRGSIDKVFLYQRCLIKGSLDAASGRELSFKGICGRICHGNSPGDFETLIGPAPAPKLAFTIGSDGLKDLIGKSSLEMLLSVGYTALYIYRSIVKDGCSFVLAVMPADSGSAWPATWDGLFEAIRSEYPDVWPLVKAVQQDLQTSSFEELEQAYMQEGWPALRAIKKGTHITLERLLEMNQVGTMRAYHVRAYLHENMHIRANFLGDGFTWRLNGERGPTEYLSRNTTCYEVRDAIFCPLGSPTVEEVIKYMCEALKEEQRAHELEQQHNLASVVQELEVGEHPPTKALNATPLEYLLWLQTHDELPQGAHLSGLCGRICRGSHSDSFRGLAEMDGTRRIVFMFGPDGLAKFLSNSDPLSILLGLGYDVMFLYEELMKGTVFELVVFKETKGVRQAIWDNLPGIVQEAFGDLGGELSAIIMKHLPDLKARSFHDLQHEYTDDTGAIMSMHDARSKPPPPAGQIEDSSPWRMTEELLLKREREGTCRAADVRAFLYHALNLNNLYSGDGYTYTHDGKRGISEYLAANLPRKELGKAGEDWVNCPIGATTVDQCMSEICSAYERVARKTRK